MFVAKAETAPIKLVGDLDQDGQITDWDGVLLKRYLANWNVIVADQRLLDIDGNGTVDDADSQMFDCYLTGWSVTTQVGQPVEYRITYENTKNAVNPNPTTYKSGSAPIALEPIQAEHYRFSGWMLDGETLTQIPTNRNEDLTLTASWKPMEYTITYTGTKGAANPNPKTYHIESNTITLENLACEGYRFDGWYRGTEKITRISAGSTGDLTLEARWTVCDYTVTYENTKGAVNTNPTSFTVESDTIQLKDLDGISHLENDAPEGKGISLRIRYASAKIVSCEDNTKNHLSLRQMLAIRDWFEQISGAGRIRRYPVEEIPSETFAEETGLDPDLSSVTNKDVVFTRIRENRTVIYKTAFATYEGNAYELFFSADTDALSPENAEWENIYSFDDFKISLNSRGQGLCEWKTDAYAYALYMPENAEEGFLEYMRLALKGILWNPAGSGA
jgi:uncharacterized repeat protein (TIGR02543 family)